jgi:hypothetical protein
MCRSSKCSLFFRFFYQYTASILLSPVTCRWLTECCVLQSADSPSPCVALHNIVPFPKVLASHQTPQKGIQLLSVHKFVLSTFCYWHVMAQW